MARLERKEYTFTCQHCLREFIKVTTPGYAKRSMYCSEACRSAAQEAKRGARYVKVEKIPQQAECVVCGTHFGYEEYPNSKRQHLYCSYQCKKRAAWLKQAASRRQKSAERKAKLEEARAKAQAQAKRLESIKRNAPFLSAVCPACGRTFEYQKCGGSERVYCSETCRNHVNKAKYRQRHGIRTFKPAPAPKPEKKVASVGYYVSNGKSVHHYLFEEDPWKSGRLPQSVTENQCFS